MIGLIINVIASVSVGIAIMAPFSTVLLLSRRIERISGARSYWHLFLISIVFYVAYVLVTWSDPFGIFSLQPLTLLSGTALLMLSALSAALGMMGLMATIDYNTYRIFLAFTSVGAVTPIILGLSLNYIATSSIPLSIAILTLLEGFLTYCFISLILFTFKIQIDFR